MDVFPAAVETDRLALEPLHESVGVHEYYRICAGERDENFEAVTQYMLWSPHEHPKETRDFLAGVAEGFEDGESAEYAISPREGEDGAGELAGATRLGVDWDRRLAEFGMWLRRPFWGRGYSGERAAALFELAFDHLDLDAVAVSHQPGNEQSRRAIEKYVEAHGGRHEGLLRNFAATQDGRVTDQHRFTVTREEYAAADTPDVGATFDFRS